MCPSSSGSSPAATQAEEAAHLGAQQREISTNVGKTMP